MGSSGHSRLVAEHEAAHAVIGVLAGLVVRRVTIAPAKDHAPRCAGYCQVVAPVDQHWPIPRTATAEIDCYAAGYAWEHVVSGWSFVVDAPDLADYPDRCSWPEDVFMEAVEHVAHVFRTTTAVQAAVEAVADALQARKSGSLWGTTVVKILTRLGVLVTGPCLRCSGGKTVAIPATGQVWPCPTCHGRGVHCGLSEVA